MIANPKSDAAAHRLGQPDDGVRGDRRIRAAEAKPLRDRDVLGVRARGDRDDVPGRRLADRAAVEAHQDERPRPLTEGLTVPAAGGGQNPHVVLLFDVHGLLLVVRRVHDRMRPWNRRGAKPHSRKGGRFLNATCFARGATYDQ